nr:hypothetical protein [Tanacetum cinerariifolium]
MSATKDSSKGKSPGTSSKSFKFGKSTKDEVVKPISVQDSDKAEHDDDGLDYADMLMDQGEDWVILMKNPTMRLFPRMIGPAYNLSKGTCKSYVELDYTIEECYRALSKKVDWNNLEGHRCPYDLTKPLLVKMSSQGHQIVQADFFFNNDLEYLKGGSNEKKYTASMTNSKAARTVIQARVEDHHLGVESCQKKLNLTKPRTQDVDMSCRPVYTILSNRQVAPILSTKEPEYSPSMGYEHPNTTPETKSDEIIKSGVEELVPILSENEVTLEDKRECDMPVCEDSSVFDVCDNHSEIFFDSNNDDDISSYDDDFEDVEYVEASLPDPEIVSLGKENVFHQEEEEFDLEDISQIQDIVLQSDNSLSDKFSPEFETFCNYTEETRSGNTTHANDSLPEYDSFCFEIEPDQERLINVLKSDIFDDSRDPLLEEANLFLAFDISIPLGIENVADDSKGDIRFLEELLIDDSILSHESSDSNFEDNPSVPLPPPEPPDEEFDFGDEILVVFLSTESEDTIFDPGFNPHRLKFLVLDICPSPKDLYILSWKSVWEKPYP